MSRGFLVQAKIGDGFDCYNPVGNESNIELTLNGDINYLDDALEVKLTNKKSFVAVDGVLRLNFGGIAFADTDVLLVTIYFYNNESQTNWIYYTVEEISGITLTADQYITFSIPVKFIDQVQLKCTEDIAKYYVGIYAETTITPDADTTFALQQYCLEGREVELAKRVICRGI